MNLLNLIFKLFLRQPHFFNKITIPYFFPHFSLKLPAGGGWGSTFPKFFVLVLSKRYFQGLIPRNAQFLCILDILNLWVVIPVIFLAEDIRGIINNEGESSLKKHPEKEYIKDQAAWIKTFCETIKGFGLAKSTSIVLGLKYDKSPI